jgi:outer membrane protein OmpA-like peptidoglycan-associated protein
MKILLIGFIAFAVWSLLSSYIYVCKIKGLCFEPQTTQIGGVKHAEINVGNTFQNLKLKVPEIIPANMIIYFAFDKSEIKVDAMADNYFDHSNKYLNQNLQATLSITGFTDATGTNEYNQALGYRRAESMQHYFENKGIPANKSIIESKGEQEPAGDNNTTEGRAINRSII